MADLEAQFEQEMIGVYERAKKECGYNASYFLGLIREQGGLMAAKHLLNKPVSEGYTRLFELQRLDLTVEALVVRNPWKTLFTPEEVKKAVKRLPKGLVP